MDYPQFQPFNLGQAMSTGQNLAVNQFRLADMQEQQGAKAGLREALTAGTPQAMDDFKKKYPEQAMEWDSKATQFKKHALDYKMEQATMLGRLASGITDQTTYERAIATAKSLDLDIGNPPPQYDPNWVTQAQNQILTVKEKVSMAHEQWQRQHGTATSEETARHNRATEAAAVTKNKIAATKASAEKGLKASDYNAVSARVADLFGGVYDPLTQKIGGLDKEQAPRALSIQERAHEMYKSGEAGTPAEAAAAAAREAGIKVPKVNSPRIPGAPANAPSGAIGAEPTAVNPQTGERVVYRNGQWQKQ